MRVIINIHVTFTLSQSHSSVKLCIEGVYFFSFSLLIEEEAPPAKVAKGPAKKVAADVESDDDEEEDDDDESGICPNVYCEEFRLN